MAISTLTSGTLSGLYIPMTNPALDCPPPILQEDFDECRIPGGVDLWESGGFYSPGVCFVGYRAVCTQTSPHWPIEAGETAVRCIPTGFDCNDEDPRFATTEFGGTTVSAPAFEIRWRTEDLRSMTPPTDTFTSTSAATGERTVTGGGGGGGATTFATLVTHAPGAISSSSPSSPDDKDEDEISPAQRGSLSTGSVAGIAVGASVGVLSMSITALFFLLKRRRRQDAEETWRQSEDTLTVSSSRLGVMAEEPPMELGDQRLEPKELAADSPPMRRGRPNEARSGP